MTVRAVLFDLDGTLADTAPDLGGALNRLRARHGQDPLPLPLLRPRVSHGARGMIELGFGLTTGDTGFSSLRDEFLQIYAEYLCVETRLFPEMETLLASLEARSLPWGIVTNKPKRFTEPLIQALKLHQRAACVVSGDSAPRAKPHPDTLLLAAEQLQLKPSREILYIGDDERDVQAARAAQMSAIVALYGYLGNGSLPQDWGADGLIERPGEALAFIDNP
jgi:N-acetyl-D-muramate 6-phosphate phosphatase